MAIRIVVALLSLALVACGDSPPEVSDRTAQSTSGGSNLVREAEFAFVTSLDEATLHPFTDSEALELGYESCDTLDRIQPRGADELIREIMGTNMSVRDQGIMASVFGAAITTLCPEWDWLAADAARGSY